MEEKVIRCPHCQGKNIIKNGFIHTKKKQNYKCKSCNRQFVENGQSWYVSDDEKKKIDKLLLERLSLRGICRVMDVSLTWLLDYLKTVYKNLPEHLNVDFAQVHKVGEIIIKIAEIEADEIG